MTTRVASPQYIFLMYIMAIICLSCCTFDLACQIALNMMYFFFQAVEDAFVPVIKFKFDGIEVKGFWMYKWCLFQHSVRWVYHQSGFSPTQIFNDGANTFIQQSHPTH